MVSETDQTLLFLGFRVVLMQTVSVCDDWKHKLQCSECQWCHALTVPILLCTLPPRLPPVESCCYQLFIVGLINSVYLSECL